MRGTIISKIFQEECLTRLRTRAYFLLYEQLLEIVGFTNWTPGDEGHDLIKENDNERHLSYGAVFGILIILLALKMDTILEYNLFKNVSTGSAYL